MTTSQDGGEAREVLETRERIVDSIRGDERIDVRSLLT